MCTRRRKLKRNSANGGGRFLGRGNTDPLESGSPEVMVPAEREDHAIVEAAVRGGSLLMMLALVQRASTFILNVLLQRTMLGEDSVSGIDVSSSLQDYGAACITLELIFSSAVFLAREPFRVALARSRAPAVGLTEEDRRRTDALRQRFVNTAWMSSPIGLVSTLAVWGLYPWVIRNDAFLLADDNRQAARLVCAAAALELMIEPLALIFQYRLLVGIRVKAEATAVLVLGFSRYLLVAYLGLGVKAFGYAQLLHSVTLASVYICTAVWEILATSRGCAHTKGRIGDDNTFSRPMAWLPAKCRSDDAQNNKRPRGPLCWHEWVDCTHLKIIGAVAGQSFLKHLLTEGDKIVLAQAVSHGSKNTSLYEQGVYAVASGYGSLAARLLFQPLEEAARMMFSKLGAKEKEWSGKRVSKIRQTPHALPSVGNPLDDRERSPVPPTTNTRERWQLRTRMAGLLGLLLKLVLVAGLIFVCFGFHYTDTLLRLLLASRHSNDDRGSSAIPEVSRVLSWYCVYVLFLAANGMCEAFACAVARGGELTGMNAGLVASFFTFWISVAPLMTRFGTRGLVMANAAGMACRVACSVVFIRRFFTEDVITRIVADGEDIPRAGSQKPTKPLRNLWRQVVEESLPHPVVLASFAVSSVTLHFADPFSRLQHSDDGVSWTIIAAAKHVALGGMCFTLTAAIFMNTEQAFLRDVKTLWATRSREKSTRVGAVDATSDSNSAAGTTSEGRLKKE